MRLDKQGKLALWLLFSSAALAVVGKYMFSALHANTRPSAWVVLTLGIFLRVISISTLGSNFSFTLVCTSTQQIIDHGIYKYIRHPSYLGSILLCVGVGLLLNNLFSSVLLTMISIFLYSMRALEEEKVMIVVLGYKYFSYMSKTTRFIPGVL